MKVFLLPIVSIVLFLCLTLTMSLKSMGADPSTNVKLIDTEQGQTHGAIAADIYESTVVFPAGYVIGDYIEFLKVAPMAAASSGNYEVSIAYTRGSIAAAATYLASISHAGANVWRELGRINSNGYIYLGSNGHNFTVDCNAANANPRFRIRAINTLGVLTSPITVYIKVRSINYNGSFTALSATGNDLTVNKFLAMTNDWVLNVGHNSSPDGAIVAIKALSNGNVGIGTATPNEKLSVNGMIRSKEVKVEVANWPDYVFEKSYTLPTLPGIEKFIHEKGHLPGIPTAAEVNQNGIELGEMNKKLLQKIEELTLHLIEQNKMIKTQNSQILNQEANLIELKNEMILMKSRIK